MGLNAVVYKRLDSFPPQVRSLLQVVDPTTGEIEASKSEGEPQPGISDLTAINIRIGNSSMIGWLADEITRRCGSKCPIILSGFLSSGSHSGDTLRPEDTEQLRLELDLIEAEGGELPEQLIGFLRAVRLLMEAAIEQRNPIVFV